jgi:hypothetical protein
MAYERKLDLMDESIFPIRPTYAQKKNPNKAITFDRKPIQLSEEEIIEAVSKEMSGTMGPYRDS